MNGEIWGFHRRGKGIMSTTDNQDEIFDVVDENDNVIGQATREECNSNPNIIHRAVFVLVHNSKNQILWQKRSYRKDTAPGKWVTSVSGHVDSGEDYRDAAIRETKEELGIDVDVEFLGKFLYQYQKENEYSSIFRAFSNGPFYYNREEIETIKFMTIDELWRKETEGEIELSKAVSYIIESLNSVLNPYRGKS
jgi:isopentenyl-diphosphate delta-isomerase type 1